MPAAYPTVSAGGPQWKRLFQESPQFAVVAGPKYADGGQDTFLGATSPTRVWVIEYTDLTEAEAATLDAHYESALGTHLSFNFTDPRTAITRSVKYLDYDNPGHEQDWILSRRVRLVHRP